MRNGKKRSNPKASWNYFLSKKIENNSEILSVKAEKEEALSKAVDILVKLDLHKKELKKKWLSDPKILERLKKEHRTEKALKVLKRSIQK